MFGVVFVFGGSRPGQGIHGSQPQPARAMDNGRLWAWHAAAGKDVLILDFNHRSFNDPTLQHYCAALLHSTFLWALSLAILSRYRDHRRRALTLLIYDIDGRQLDELGSAAGEASKFTFYEAEPDNEIYITTQASIYL